MEQELTTQLEELGLDRKEANIYLAILEFGPIVVSDIAKKSGIKRPTIYNYVNGLIAKNLIFKTFKGKRTLYIAENPKKIVFLLDDKRKKIENLLPKLQLLYQASPKQPKIIFYEGKNGLRKIYEEIFNTSQIVYSIFSPDSFFKVFTREENANFIDVLRQNGGKIYDFVEKTEFSEKFKKDELGKDIRKVKFLADDFKLSIDILVAGDKTAMISFQNLIGIIIDNKEIADTQREVFKFMWKRL